MLVSSFGTPDVIRGCASQDVSDGLWNNVRIFGPDLEPRGSVRLVADTQFTGVSACSRPCDTCPYFTFTTHLVPPWAKQLHHFPEVWA